MYREINMKTFKLTFILAALFAFISCGNSSADVNSNAGNPAEEQVQQSQTQSVANATETAAQPDKDPAQKSKGSDKPIQMDKQMFLNKVFDYEGNPKQWKFEGDRPCIIDFYADWCGPCKRVAPIMDDIAKEYQGKVDVYKVDTDKQRELASVFGIRSIPSVMFCPAEGKPYMYTGAFPKSKYLELINKHFEL